METGILVVGDGDPPCRGGVHGQEINKGMGSQEVGLCVDRVGGVGVPGGVWEF